MVLIQFLTEVIMAGKTKRAALLLTEDQKTMLKELSRSRTAPAREIERAKVLIGYADGISIVGLQRQIGVSRPMIYKCIDKALAAGALMGLKDTYHRPHEPEISDEARAWVASIACTKPKDHGLAAELWTISSLASFVSERAEPAGFPRLAHAGKSTVWRILDENEIKPHKIRYYLEKRDPEFEKKMQQVKETGGSVPNDGTNPYLVHPLMDPLKIKSGIRESCDSAEQLLSLAIIFLMDVSGSMGFVPEQLRTRYLCELMKFLLGGKLVVDPQIMFAAFADVADRCFLQVGQFELGTEMHGDLSRLRIGGGGGSAMNSSPRGGLD